MVFSSSATTPAFGPGANDIATLTLVDELLQGIGAGIVRQYN
jgi:hypothetical protein